MKKRLTALLLSFAMAFAIGAPSALADGTRETAKPAAQAQSAAAAKENAAAADDRERETPEDAGAQETAGPELDAEGTLSFENLRPRIIANYYPARALQESIEDLENNDYDWQYDYLRLSINENLAEQRQRAMDFDFVGAATLSAHYDQLWKDLKAIADGEKQKDDAASLRQQRNAQNQAIIVGESLYITLKNLEAKDAALAQTIAQLERAEQEMQLRCKLGQISELTALQASTGLVQAVSGRETLNMNRESILLQLESMVGAELGEPLALGALPKVTAAELDAMDLEADLEKAKAASYEIFDAKKQVEDFRKDTYDKLIELYGVNEKSIGVSQARHALQTYQYNCENTILTYELNFRTLYAQVKDAAQVLSAKRAALAEQEKSYAVSALKYEQGSISANALADAKDELSSAKDDVSTAERELFSKYRTYTWAVDYGILNA